VEHQPRPIAAKLDVAKRDQRLARRGLERRRQRRQLAGRRVVVVVEAVHPGQIDQLLFFPATTVRSRTSYARSVVTSR
jgi:pheromone shutdown protein TraB